MQCEMKEKVSTHCIHLPVHDKECPLKYHFSLKPPISSSQEDVNTYGFLSGEGVTVSS